MIWKRERVGNLILGLVSMSRQRASKEPIYTTSVWHVFFPHRLKHVLEADTEILLLLAMAIAKSVKCRRVSLPLIWSYLYKHYKDSR